MEVPGKVFISYSHDNENHIDQVLNLSNKLRSDGIDCEIDQYEDSPPEGWPVWTSKKILDAVYVLIICTETYYKRIMKEEAPGKGHGVSWEGHLIYQVIYNAGTQNKKFIPIIFDHTQRSYIPDLLQGSSNYYLNPDTWEGYENLYRRLLNKSKADKPKLGQLKPLPKKSIKTDPKMFITGPINTELWNKAKWNGAFFVCYPDTPPTLGLCFKNESEAKEIFENWHLRYGDNDEYEELRISIIEGDIPNEKAGYSIHINVDAEATVKRLQDVGYDHDIDDYIVSIGRIHRMNPSSNSKNLENFKKAYKKFKTYLLIPVIMQNNQSLTPLFKLGIRKGKIYFRKVEDIKEHDIDKVILEKTEANNDDLHIISSTLENQYTEEEKFIIEMNEGYIPCDIYNKYHKK